MTDPKNPLSEERIAELYEDCQRRAQAVTVAHMKDLLCDFIDATHFVRTAREKEILGERGEELLGIKQERYRKVFARDALAAQSEAGKGRDDVQQCVGISVDHNPVGGPAGTDSEVPMPRTVTPAPEPPDLDRWGVSRSDWLAEVKRAEKAEAEVARLEKQFDDAIKSCHTACERAEQAERERDEARQAYLQAMRERDQQHTRADTAESRLAQIGEMATKK